MAGEIASTETAQAARTDDDKEKETAAARKAAAGPFVKYTGPETGSGSYAEITAAQWSEAGIAPKSPQTTVWKLQNEWRVPATEFSKQQLDMLLDVDGRFVLVDGAGKKVDR